MRILAVVVGTAMLLVSCGGSAGGPTVPAAESISPFEAQTSVGSDLVAADRPLEISFTEQFPALEPCSNTIQMVTVDWSCRARLENGAQVYTCKRTTTIADFTGHGTHTQVINGHVLNFRVTDILRNDAGARAKVQIHLVLDLSTGTVRVDELRAVCLTQ